MFLLHIAFDLMYVFVMFPLLQQISTVMNCETFPVPVKLLIQQNVNFTHKFWGNCHNNRSEKGLFLYFEAQKYLLL